MLRGRVHVIDQPFRRGAESPKAMNDKRFLRPITIVLEPSRARSVATAFEALECLSGSWPIITSHAYRVAVQCCRDSLDGLKSAQAAQHAFAEAAREAGVLAAAARRAAVPTPVTSRSSQMSSSLFSAQHLPG